MPLCQGCGASYDDTYKFCPHCGRAKPELQAINLNVQVVPVRYEEAVLTIEVVGMTELTEPPFDYRPSGLTSVLGQGGRNWKQFTTYRLLIDNHHPETGQHVAYHSKNAPDEVARRSSWPPWPRWQTWSRPTSAIDGFQRRRIT